MARRYDVFNGDADGICALHQLRLAEPAEAVLVTGVKRDIRLLGRVPAEAGARVTVLDISLDANREPLEALLAAGAEVVWFDHHYAGEIPDHPHLGTHIDPAPTVCTSLLVDAHLGGRWRAWAVAAAFGDNLHQAARDAAGALELDEVALADLRRLGELINYNGYGETPADLHFAPEALYRALRPYADPLAFYRQAPEAAQLAAGFEADLARAESREPILDGAGARAFHYPAEPWARRVMGTVANRLAHGEPARATAIVVDNADGSLRISVRAPLDRPAGADALCRRFPTGGGRAGAGGVNALPPERLEAFLAAFAGAYPG